MVFPSPLGQLIPSDNQHAVSVSLPLWQDTVDYEEGRARVLDALKGGYPRFVFHQRVLQLTEWTRENYAIDADHELLLFPAEQVGNQCAKYIEQRSGKSCKFRLFEVPVPKLQSFWAFVYPSSDKAFAKEFWQHTGTAVSSRYCETALAHISGDFSSSELTDTSVKDRAEVVARLAGFYSVPETSVLLYECGMSSIYNIHRTLQHINGGAPTLRFVQFGFPYLDTLKILQRFGTDCLYFPHGTDADIQALEEQLKTQTSIDRIVALFCELPSNPLLKTPPLKWLHELALEYGFVIVVDDTLSNFINTSKRLLEYADVLVCSLTKIFSGKCNVMAGSAILNPRSVHFPALFECLCSSVKSDYSYVDHLWKQDLTVLNQNSKTCLERCIQTNINAEQLADFLHAHPKVQTVFYPKYTDASAYEHFRSGQGTSTAGYGSLLSILLKDPAVTTQKYYDALEILKGPSLGTEFTLACPYTMIAHYTELEQVEREGVSRWLIRVSAGSESGGLVETFKKAFDAI